MWLQNVIETIFGLGLFINAALFLPQIIRLHKTKSSEGVSLLMFGGFCLLQLLTIFHGIIHKDYLLIVGYILSLIACGTVTVQILLYRQ
jgi:MtN3 and saliva related transmembrane protein